ncbi:MAG: hypothetical protein L0Y72_15010 [Gemmataceae bacterium]|nr:hypothetical protein [Gemmataceae bacterium]MCI0740353.1 hypothetical protein [Gemmataceae bacterium]
MRFVFSVALALVAGQTLRADEPVTLANFTPPGDNRKDEPLIQRFSLVKATHFLDNASADWLKQKACFSCHTNYAFLYARPLVSSKDPVHGEVRQALEELVTERWPKKGPRWDAEVIASAAALAFNDANTTGKLHPVTKIALDRMWTVQRKDGGISWLKCAWPPMESDDHYGVTLAALAVGVAPQQYAEIPQAKKGLAGMLYYFKANRPTDLHHKAMMLWVSTYLKDFWSEKEQQDTIRQWKKLQLPDGGWSSANFGAYKRADKSEQQYGTSDGYGTGFSIYVLRRAGVPISDQVIQKGLAWLKRNQRESGRWFTRSLYRDNRHYLTHVGTAFAVMALAECGALQK